MLYPLAILDYVTNLGPNVLSFAPPITILSLVHLSLAEGNYVHTSTIKR